MTDVVLNASGVANPTLQLVTTDQVTILGDGSLERPLRTAEGAGGVPDGNKGDITVSGAGLVWTINNGVVTLVKMADLAADRFLGRANGAGIGVPQALTPAQANTILPAATATVKGLVPTPPNDAAQVLRGDATWGSVPGGSQVTKLLAIDYTNATAIGSEVAGLTTPLTPGTYQFKIALRWRVDSAAGALAVSVNFDAAHAFLLATGTFPVADYTGPNIASQTVNASTGSAVAQVYSQRAASIVPVTMSIAVDLANADQLAIIEGIVEVTAPGNLELWLSAPAALTTITAKAGSSISALPVV
jgi:hypothetical protein